MDTDDNAGLIATRGRGRFEVVVCVCVRVCAWGRPRGLWQKKNEAVRLCVVCERHEHLLEVDVPSINGKELCLPTHTTG